MLRCDRATPEEYGVCNPHTYVCTCILVGTIARVMAVRKVIGAVHINDILHAYVHCTYDG